MHKTGHERITIDDSISSRELALLGTASGTLVVSVAVAVAVWKISTGVMWALIILSIGSAVEMVCIGIGIYHRHRLAGQAQLVEAEGRAKAGVIDAKSRLIAARREGVSCESRSIIERNV